MLIVAKDFANDVLNAIISRKVIYGAKVIFSTLEFLNGFIHHPTTYIIHFSLNYYFIFVVLSYVIYTLWFYNLLEGMCH